MKLRPQLFPASEGKHFTKDDLAHLRKIGILPIVVNDVWIPTLNRPERIQPRYGGSGSSKSDWTATQMLYKSMTQPYCRVVFCRKYREQIRDSQFLLFKGLIERYALQDFFQVKEADMDIICVNGNMLLSAGLDDVDKLKSIPDITDIWLEEPIDRKGSVKREDFTELNRRLRCPLAENHIYLTFNPVSKESWIYKDLFEKDIYDVYAVKTTYKDNNFLPPDEAKQFEILKQISPEEYKIYGEGEWGSNDSLENRLFLDVDIADLFTNDFPMIRTGKRYQIADIALEGKDPMEIYTFDGWAVIDKLSVPRSNGRQVLGIMENRAKGWNVPGQNICFDASGLGGFLTGFLQNSRPFVGAAQPVMEDRPNEMQKKTFNKPHFLNLRAQCFYHLSKKMADNEAYLPVENESLKDRISTQLRAIEKIPMPDGGKYQIIPKSEIIEKIGYSPNDADVLSMRSLFDLQPVPQQSRRRVAGF